MSIRLKGNGLWTSSRMFLPEHKENNNRYNDERGIRIKPVLDEQKLEELGELLRMAYEESRAITVVVFGKYADQSVTGQIGKVDVLQGRIWIDGQRIVLADMVDGWLVKS
jgi:hypothetical protein